MSMPAGSEADRVVARYLAQLDSELRQLPTARRRQILDEVSSHIAEDRATGGIEDEIGILSLLERVGDPGDIAAEALAGEPAAQRRWWDVMVPWLLLFGGFVFFIGWFLGVGLLWSSPTWNLRDKLLATVVWPGGLSLFLAVLPFGFAQSGTCVSGPGQAAVLQCTSHGFGLPAPVSVLAVVVLLAAPFAVAIHLERVRRRG